MTGAQAQATASALTVIGGSGMACDGDACTVPATGENTGTPAPS
ncbi:hypothetical protein [Microbacterium awajiense]